MKPLTYECEDILANPEKGLKIIRRFENIFADSQDAQWAVGVNSATSGILASLIAAGIGRGDEVIVPSLTWPQTYFPAAFLGAALVAADLSEKWPVMDPIKVSSAVTKKTKVILSAGLWGFPAGIKEIDEIAKKKGIPHICDASQLINCKIQNSGIGALADLVVTSFGSTKKILGCGEGGMVLGNDPNLKDKILLTTQHPFRVHSETESWDFPELIDGFNFNFRLHPATALVNYHFIRQKKRNIERVLQDRQEMIRGILNQWNLKELHPPGEWAPIKSNKSFMVVKIEKNVDCLQKVIEELEKKGIYAHLSPYGLISDVVHERKGYLFPWLKKNKIPLHPSPGKANFDHAERWKNQLLLIPLI